MNFIISNHSNISKIKCECPYFSGLTDSNIAQFKFSKGRNFRIRLVMNNGNLINGSGTYITIVKNNVKFGIFQKKFFGSYEEAICMAKLWNDIVRNSSTKYKSIINRFEVIDCSNLSVVYSTTC